MDPSFVPQPDLKAPPRPGKVARFDGCSMSSWNQMVGARMRDPKSLPQQRRIGRAEVALHADGGDLLMVIHGVVYDCSSWARYHPGGAEVLMDAAGKDGSALYDFYHRWVACEQIMAPFKLGPFDPTM